MSQVVFYAGVTSLVTMNSLALLLLMAGRRGMVRVLAADTLTLLLVGLLILLSAYLGTDLYIRVALFLSLLAFIATLVAALYEAEGKLFR